MKNWIKDAVKPNSRGVFKLKAQKAGKSTAEYADEKADAPGKLGKEARFAKTMQKMKKK